MAVTTHLQYQRSKQRACEDATCQQQQEEVWVQAHRLYSFRFERHQEGAIETWRVQKHLPNIHVINISINTSPSSHAFELQLPLLMERLAVQRQTRIQVGVRYTC